MKKLLVLKEEIIDRVKLVKNPEQRVLLELRYLCFKQWEEVADIMGYSVQNAYKIHDKALMQLQVDNLQIEVGVN